MRAASRAQAEALPGQVAVVYTPATGRGPLPGPVAYTQARWPILTGARWPILGLDSRAQNLTQAVKRSFISEALFHPACATGAAGRITKHEPQVPTESAAHTEKTSSATLTAAPA